MRTMILRHIITQLRQKRQQFFHDSLFRNALYLMASTAIMAALGFVFWLFVAHLYSPSDIGVASALISVTMLISNLSMLGLNAGIMRFLSGSRQQSRDINAASLAIIVVTVLASLVYVMFDKYLGGHIALLDGGWHKLAFVVLMATVTLNSLTDAVFIANRRGEYHTIGYATFGVVKLVLPLVLTPFGSLGIFGAYILAMLASLIVSYFLMRRGGYRLLTRPHWGLLRGIRKYALHNYISVVIAGLPAQVVPLIILRRLGAADVAYFSMAWTMVNLLYIVPNAAAQSLLAESSFDGGKAQEHVMRTIRLLTLVLIPAVLLAVVVSPYLLGIFGGSYRQHGAAVFQTLSAATFFVALTYVGTTVLNIKKQSGRVAVVQLISSIVTGAMALLLVGHGLAWVGLAFMAGNIASSGVLLFYWLKDKRQAARTVAYGDATVPHNLLAPYGISSFVVHTLAAGKSTRTQRIDTPAGRYVLRSYTGHGLSDEAVIQELEFMEYLCSHGIPTPVVRPAADGNYLQHAMIDGITWRYILMEYAEGDHPDRYRLPLVENLATLQAAMHRYGTLFARQQRHHSRSISLLLVLRHWLLRPFVPYGFSHFDFDASNILVQLDRVSCVLDFEGMRFGPLVSCLYFTLRRIYEQTHDVHLVVAYLAAYQRQRPLTATERLLLRCGLVLRSGRLAFLGVSIKA